MKKFTIPAVLGVLLAFLTASAPVSYAQTMDGKNPPPAGHQRRHHKGHIKGSKKHKKLHHRHASKPAANNAVPE